MTDTPSVQEALSAVMADVQAVKKGDQNKQQNYSFRGVDAVVNAVGPALRAHGVLVLPSVQSCTYGEFTTKSGTVMHTCSVIVEYRFVGPAGDTLTCSAPGESADAGDKATPKAMSVAFRTALLQALCIPTDEPDPDSSSYERAAPVQPMSASQAKALAESLSKLDDGQKAELKKWWRSQRFPRQDALSHDQAETVLNHLDAVEVGADA